MDDKTLEALRGSIAKWESIVAGTERISGSDGCPLCDLFNDGDEHEDNCQGCPVRAKTGEPYCFDTPYYDARLGSEGAAQRELDFLKSLLPPEIPSNDDRTKTPL